ncbi:MAG: helix-turn-helix domain-containing protein, partial [Acidimicrobiia bacterium]
MTTDKIPLRQRKKERARLAIQAAALTLFEDQGYDNTTVEQIAAVAEVSPSTVYRYFTTKD